MSRANDLSPVGATAREHSPPEREECIFRPRPGVAGRDRVGGRWHLPTEDSTELPNESRLALRRSRIRMADMRRLFAHTALCVAFAFHASLAFAQADSAPSGSPGGTQSATTTTATAPEMDAGTFAVRLRDLEQRINELKEQVFRSKGRLALLAETVLEGTVGGAQLLVRHEHRMTSTFELVRVVYLLDGAQIFPTAQSPTGEALAEQEEFDVYRGSVVPGEHTLSVTIEYQGNGHGVFAYLQGYHFTVRSSHSFTAPEGRALTLRVVALENGGQTTPIEDRPTVRFVESVTDELGEGTASEGAAE